MEVSVTTLPWSGRYFRRIVDFGDEGKNKCTFWIWFKDGPLGKNFCGQRGPKIIFYWRATNFLQNIKNWRTFMLEIWNGRTLKMSLFPIYRVQIRISSLTPILTWLRAKLARPLKKDFNKLSTKIITFRGKNAAKEWLKEAHRFSLGEAPVHLWVRHYL